MSELAVASTEALTTAGAQPAVVVVDDLRCCVEANEIASHILGARRGDVVGKRFDAMIVPSMRERIEHLWRAFQESGGNAGPFTLETGGEIQISMTPNIAEGRHLLVLSPITAEAAAISTRPERAPSRGRDPSDRERQVLALLAGGSTDPQIAEELTLSPATVQTHVRNAKAKLGARTRAQAVAMAIAAGLIDAE